MNTANDSSMDSSSRYDDHNGAEDKRSIQRAKRLLKKYRNKNHAARMPDTYSEPSPLPNGFGPDYADIHRQRSPQHATETGTVYSESLVDAEVMSLEEGGEGRDSSASKHSLYIPQQFHMNSSLGHQPTATYGDSRLPMGFPRDAATAMQRMASPGGSTRPAASTTNYYGDGAHCGAANSVSSFPMYYNTKQQAPSSFQSGEAAGVAQALRNTLAERDREIREVRGRLQELHGHYSQLHAAYQSLSQNPTSTAMGTSGEPMELGNQIMQLQTALAVAIDEKTNLQAQLRSRSAQVASLEEETQSLRNLREAVANSSSRNDSEIRLLSEEKTKLLETVASQSAMLEQQRRECSHTEAQILIIQQDRNEAQARLKHLHEEKQQANRLIEQLRDELSMKEIYVKQLTAHSQGQDQDQELIQRLIEERNDSAAEAELRRSELSELKRQLAATQTHYETSMADTNSRMARLQVEVSELKTSKSELQSTKSYLEEQIRLMRMHAATTIMGRDSTGKGDEEGSHAQPEEGGMGAAVCPRGDSLLAEFEAMRNSYEALEEENRRCVAHAHELEEVVRLKFQEERLENLHARLCDSQRRVEALETAESVRETINSDAALLSQQLQNEKATVSRAVSQNVELKNRLAELEEKLVRVVNESAERETERVSALCEANALRHRVDELMQAQAETKNSIAQKNIPTSADKEQQTIIVEALHPEMPALSAGEGRGETTEEQTGSLPVEAKEEEARKQPNSSSPNAATAPPVTSTALTEPEAIPTRVETTSDQVEPKVHNNGSTSMLIEQLERRLEAALEMNQQYHLSNRQLQYWLTALETENESIGEYVALYRFQRGNVQRRLAEKEAALDSAMASNQQLKAQLEQLQHAVLEVAGRQSGVVLEQPTPIMAKAPLEPPSAIDDAVEATVKDLNLNNMELTINGVVPTLEKCEAAEPKPNHYDQPASPSRYSAIASNAEYPPLSEHSWHQFSEILNLVEEQRLHKPKEPMAIADGAHCEEDTTQEKVAHCDGCVECKGEMVEL